MDQLPDDFFTTSFQFTEHVHRDIYPAIDPTSSNLSQSGKVVIISGAGGGISRAGIIPAFAKAGAKAIVLVGRNPAALESIETEIHAIAPKVELLSVSADVSSETSVAALFELIKNRFGTVDVLVNNAGVIAAENVPFKDGAFDEWWSNFNVNTKGTALMSRYFLQLLGTEKRGTIVSLTAGLAVMVRPGVSAYSISKLATFQTMAFVAAENPNVTAVGLHPGIVKTRLVSGPLERFAKDTPALVGGVSVWLATDAARFLSGRFVAANWSIDDLVAQEKRILRGDLLTVKLSGEFGVEQFRK